MLAEARVLEVRYAFDTRTVYEAEPLKFEAQNIQYVLRKYLLYVRPLVPFVTIGGVREEAETVLRSWVLQRQLTHGFCDFRFAFQGAETVGNVKDMSEHRTERRECVKDDKGELVIALRDYPEPPRIRASPEIEMAAARLCRSNLTIGESLQSAAYFALTLAERSAGGRRGAASRLSIDREILDRMGHLSSARGDLATARKAPYGDPAELGVREQRWLERAVRVLLLQMGQANAGSAPSRVTMTDVGPA